MHDAPKFVVKDAFSAPLAAHDWGAGHPLDHAGALAFILTWLAANLVLTNVIGAGHRVLLGGDHYEGPVLITPEVLAQLDAFAEMEPSHQAFNIRGARAVATSHPDLPQVACFDSAFHRTMPEVAQT